MKNTAINLNPQLGLIAQAAQLPHHSQNKEQRTKNKKHETKMKSLNITSTQTFIRLIALMKGNQHLKLDNAPGAFIPLSIEFLYFTQFGQNLAKVYSLAHYYEQNGDLVPDPDMTFLFIDPPPKAIDPLKFTAIYPMTFQNILGYEEAIFQNDQSKWQYKPKTLSNLIDFSHLWLKNIKFQQEI